MSPDSKPNRGPSPSCGSDRSIRTRKTGLDCRITKGVWAAPAIRGRGDRPGLITIQCKAPASGSGGQCAGACQSMLRRPPPRPAAVALAAGPGPGDPRAAGFQGPGRRGLGRQRRGRLAGVRSAVQSQGAGRVGPGRWRPGPGDPGPQSCGGNFKLKARRCSGWAPRSSWHGPVTAACHWQCAPCPCPAREVAVTEVSR